VLVDECYRKFITDLNGPAVLLKTYGSETLMNPGRSQIWAVGLLLCAMSDGSSPANAVETIVELRLQTVKSLQGVVTYGNGDIVIGAKVAELAPDWKTELRATSTDSEGISVWLR